MYNITQLASNGSIVRNQSQSSPSPSSQQQPLQRQQRQAIFSFEAEFEKHKRAIRINDMEEALQTFVLLQANGAENKIFKAYIIEFSDHIDPARNTDISLFFASLPALIQSTIIEAIAASLERKDAIRAYQALFDYIHNYSRHAYKYLIRAIKLLVLGAQTLSQTESKKYIRILVTELFPRLCKQRIVLTDSDIHPAVKSTDGKQCISIPYNLFEQYLLLGQQHYIERREWHHLSTFTNMMLDCCGYSKSPSEPTHNSSSNRFQHLHKKRHYLHIDTHHQTPQLLHISVVFMFEFKAVAADFIRLSNEYYRAVCMLDDGSQEKSCLIPICAMKSTGSKDHGYQDANTAIQPEYYQALLSATVDSSEQDEAVNTDSINENNKRSRSPLSSSTEKRRKLIAYPDRGGEGLDSYCMGGVDNALQILSQAADCMRHAVELWDWALKVALPESKSLDQLYGSWEQEFLRVIDVYQLPFDLTNAVLLVRSDLALSSPSTSGNLAKALKLSQSICDRIEVQRQKYKNESETPPELEVPFMFAFRVLYNISVIYLLVDSLPQSILEIAIILSVFPIPSYLDDSDFLADEADCRTITAIFQEHEFGLMRVTQQGLVVRCIKHLVVSLDSSNNRSSQKNNNSMASIDAALRWDEKAGQIIVLMQFGWNYWSTRTNFWHKIVSRMREKKMFRNRTFLEYVYDTEILQTFQHLHKSKHVTLDIIPPEFAIRSGYRYFGQQPTQQQSSPHMNLVSHIQFEEQNPRLIKLPSLSSITAAAAVPLPPPSLYQPSYSNTILPSMTMSPTWYSASTQKNSHVNWMSPSFYYSRPATSVMLPKKSSKEDHRPEERLPAPIITTATPALSLPTSDIVTRCLDYRVRKYSPKMTPPRMKQVLQRFLKNILAKANEL
ncbi:hypothetical protein MAM1_0247c08687 [Mucor ambiguus]|uniref:Uncharacterized protein n=1 Tax=Mucor ambiguus TaxID=91626 RepID=A0A0C9LWV1_9FUNG|nr:hypothetical protein MAM1_0247c08687 [Mucor ambiguus]